ncbi:aminotransferase class I/II-fold pyridoxal phosphate-dependent enzyme [Aliidiomarina maris]|uniref:aminotransferase class I/II-fold pyridoxal phosphate-dependent enzyme n=1 Tax=Aliidiomarina maris TaxID=531312 RepID=UPI001F53F231|nr:aminotransferase class I/II-fold pyridoxal phosphate-dependent enzyme [Aliidiomarina maris]
MHFNGEHVSIARYYPEGTIISDGISKWAGAGGWRLGAFAFPPQLSWLADAMATYLQHSRQVLSALADYAYSRLTDVGAQIIKPQGGFHLFPDFSALTSRLAARGIDSGESFCAQLLEQTGVACLPGSCFGRPAQELSLRLAYVDFDGAAALAALAAGEALDYEFLQTYCGQVVTAIDLLHDFVS